MAASSLVDRQNLRLGLPVLIVGTLQKNQPPHICHAPHVTHQEVRIVLVTVLFVHARANSHASERCRMTDGASSDEQQPPTASTDKDSLAAALARHQVELDDDQIELLDRYAKALWRWNEQLNLTRHTDYERFVSRDVVDSMALEPFLDAGQRVLDVGTGGGVPGIVLAIVRPDLEVTLCDSVAKKAKVAEAIVAELGLNVVVRHAAAQELLDRQEFDVLVARAVAPLAKLLGWFSGKWSRFDRLLVIKGPAWIEERHAAREAGLLRKLELRKLTSYPLPGTQSESVVLSISAKA